MVETMAPIQKPSRAPAAVLTTIEGTGKKTSQGEEHDYHDNDGRSRSIRVQQLLYFCIGGFLEEEEWNQDHSKEQSNDGGPRAHNPQ